jgi:hypothetical protein
MNSNRGIESGSGMVLGAGIGIVFAPMLGLAAPLALVIGAKSRVRFFRGDLQRIGVQRRWYPQYIITMPETNHSRKTTDRPTPSQR